MNIIYLTTSQKENDYVSFSKKWKISLNTSNQNFHNKIIRCLAQETKVDVISVRPLSHHNSWFKRLKRKTIEEGNIIWHYVPISYFKHLRCLSAFLGGLSTVIKNRKNAVIVTDTINPKCSSIAKAYRKLFKIPVIGLCTDTPSNISGTSRKYTEKVLSLASDLDGYISLTEHLNSLFNQNNKPYLVFEGIVEDDKDKSSNKLGDYFFFGGAMLSKYGIYTLIDAFKKLNNSDIKLILCGHHANQVSLKDSISSQENILDLRSVPYKQVLHLEKHAIANINPRPFTQDLDRYSIPSKVLEYFASGRPTISVVSTPLTSKFKNEAIWLENGTEQELINAMKKVLEMTENERKDLGVKAKALALNNYSFKEICNKIMSFINDVQK